MDFEMAIYEHYYEALDVSIDSSLSLLILLE